MVSLAVALLTLILQLIQIYQSGQPIKIDPVQLEQFESPNARIDRRGDTDETTHLLFERLTRRPFWMSCYDRGVTALAQGWKVTGLTVRSTDGTNNIRARKIEN